MKEGKLLGPLAQGAVKALNWWSPNRGADPRYINILHDTFPLCAHYWAGSRKENWYLDILAVHPDCQGKGIGRELVQWGIDTAKNEGVPASLVLHLLALSVK
jgi:GNAT superfamily N-acetyltransferase